MKYTLADVVQPLDKICFMSSINFFVGLNTFRAENFRMVDIEINA